MEQKKEQRNMFVIPKNFKDNEYVFGFFKFRNFIEAIIISVLLLLLINSIFSFLGNRILIFLYIIIIAPIGIFSLIGYKSESISQLIIILFNFIKNRRKLRMKRITTYQEDERMNKDFKFYKGYTQDMIPIKNINLGIIETNDQNYIKILEITPINFDLMSLEEKESIIAIFYSVLAESKTTLQFKVITNKADVDRFVELVKIDLKKETNEKAKELAKEYIKLIQKIGKEKALTRKFYLIFKYSSDTKIDNSSKQKIYKDLNVNTLKIKSILEKCGNHVKEFKNEEYFLGNMLFQFFNKRSCVEERFEERVQRCTKDLMQQKGLILGIDQIPQIDIKNFICPRGIDFTHKDYIIMDGMYYSFLYIESNGYPDYVKFNWLSDLIEAGDGIDIDLFLTKQNGADNLAKINRAIVLKSTTQMEMQRTNNNFEKVGGALMGAHILKEGINNQQDLFYMNVIITVQENNLENLMYKVKLLTSQKNFSIKKFTFLQENALKTTMPFSNIDPIVYRRSKQNVLTSTCASSYVFTSFEYCDQNGLVMGVNQKNKSLCVLDNFDTKLYTNANMTIFGTSGSGKTFSLQLMALRMRARGIQTFIIAPLKGHEYKRACKSIGGSFIKISSSSNTCINIMEIRPIDKTSDKILDGDDYMEESLLAKKIDQLNIFFGLLFGELSDVESSLLEECILETYLLKGITHDNASLYDSDGNLKTMPILGDVYERICEYLELSRISMKLNKFVNGSARVFNNQTNVDLNNKYIVIDVSDLKDGLKALGMFIALDFYWDKIKEDRTKKKALFIDEVWNLLLHQNSANFVIEIFKIVRAYGASAIAASQNVVDFFNNKNGVDGSSILNNSAIKMILQMQKNDAYKLKEVLELTSSELIQIQTFNPGSALLLAGERKATVQMQASKYEHDLITTDRAELEKQIQNKKKEEEKK